MDRNSESGFTMMELMVATAALLIVLSGALTFFSKSQGIYSNERGTLSMVQDMRLAFDELTTEIRMAGAGLAPQYGVISGDNSSLVVRGDFANINTTVVSKGPAANIFIVGATKGFAAGQSVSLYSIQASRSMLARITAIDTGAKTITVDSVNTDALSAGATLGDFGPGTVMNVFERRTYTVAQDEEDNWGIRRVVSYDTVGAVEGSVLADEIIARNVMDENAGPGLTFKYFDKDNVELAGTIDPTEVYQVQISLRARTDNRDTETNNYRMLNITSLVQVRNMYQ
jgi:prepilin-type N-terminal cleavage/methylation domain-containing protein